MDEPDGFEVIPAIDLEGGQVVQLVGGERGTGRQYGDPAAAAERWVEAGARTLHVVDLDGAFDGQRANQAAIDTIRETVNCRMQLGGGIRTTQTARSLLDRGIDRVILGTAAVENPSIVEELSTAYPERIIVSLDARGGEVVVEGWTESSGLSPAAAAERYAELGAGAILFTNVDVEGRLGGVDRQAIAQVVTATDIPVIASGGVSSIDDLRTVRDVGAAGAVVGTALYEGAFTLADAIDAVGRHG